MARPVKEGLDYFPRDTAMDDDERYLLSEFGLKGFAIIAILTMKIHREHGYYCEWNKRVASVFCRYDCGISKQGDGTVLEVVNFALKIGIFDEDMFEKYGILTSRRIQEDYLNATKQRNVKIEKAYSLVNNAQKTVSNSKNTPAGVVSIHDNAPADGVSNSKNPTNKIKRNNTKLNNNTNKPDAVKTAPAASEAVITIPLNTGEDYPIMQSDIDEWSKLYPIVDVLQELRNMKGWCDANPAKRKTKRGVKRFINSWLSRRQDRGGNYQYGSSFNQQKNTPPDADTIAREKMLDDSYDEDMQAIWDAVEGKQ